MRLKPDWFLDSEKSVMKSRFILFRRAGFFYSEDTVMATILEQLPTTGPLFAKISGISENARSAEFYRRFNLLGIEGVSLHSCRYAWAERARTCGYPERFAQAALGHNSKAVHRAYAKKAHVLIPTLDDYERKMAVANAVIVPMPAAVA